MTTLNVIFLIFLSAVPLPAQGLYWESEMKDAVMGGSSLTTKYYYSPRMFKQVMESRNEFMIFLLDQQTIIRANTQLQAYSRITFNEFKQRLKSLSGKGTTNSKSREGIKNTSPVEQATVAIDVVRPGGQKHINGYQCPEFEIRRGGKKFYRIWATQDIPGFPAMKKDMEEFLVQTTKLKPDGEILAKHIKKVEGFPIQIEYGGMTNTVTKIVNRTIPISEFAVPPGYKFLPPKPLGKASSK